MSIDEFDAVLLAGAAVLLAAILAVRLSVRAGFPSLLVYLGLGILLGDSVIGIRFDDAELAHVLGLAALMLILSEGGLTTKWADIRPAMGVGLLLATVGVAASVVLVALPVHYLLGLEWKLAVLLGAVVSATDAAAVFSVLRGLPLRASVRGTLESESGLNDAPIVILVTLISTDAISDHSPPVLVAIIVGELALGGVIGYVVGRGGVWVMARAALPSAGLYPLAILAFTVLAYAGAQVLHASGFVAVYLAALVLGNADLPHRGATRSFAEGVGWLAQIGLFVMLGLLASPGRFEWWHAYVGLVAGAILTFVVRPLTVSLCASWFRVPWREQAFMGWGGLRGAVPIVLTTIPLAEGVSKSEDLFDIVFVLVVVFTLVQGPTLPWVARRLEVTEEGSARDVDIEAAPLERVSADLLEIRVPPRSRLHGVEVGELRLPKGASVSLVVRAGEPFVPERTTRIERGDALLVVTPRGARPLTEQRLRAVSLGGRLAGWFETRR
ncbi:MAG TPA: potassium/proton antiporter [Nocardioidaceae bacterium]|nr:potassium/proton antiporter [Nocardioidaceae bacterium]